MNSLRPDTRTPRVLGEVERALLVELFAAMPDAQAGVDSVVFRAQHHDKLQTLNTLETENLIRKEQERYFVSLPALALIDSQESNELLARAELLYAAMRSEYRDDPRRGVSVSALASSACLEELDARRALSYMFSASSLWTRSHPTDVLVNKDGVIVASEGILERKDFKAVVDQVDAWRIQGDYGYSYVDQSTVAAWQSYGSAGQASTPSSSSPDWLLKLPPTLCQVMTEVYAAVDLGLRALPAIGVRTALDLVFSDILGGDRGTFEGKVRLLKGAGFLSDAEQAHVLAVIDGGNASAHRGYLPDDEDLATFLAVAVRLLQARYVLPGASARLRSNTPARPPRS